MQGKIAGLVVLAEEDAQQDGIALNLHHQIHLMERMRSTPIHA